MSKTLTMKKYTLWDNFGKAGSPEWRKTLDVIENNILRGWDDKAISYALRANNVRSMDTVIYDKPVILEWMLNNSPKTWQQFFIEVIISHPYSSDILVCLLRNVRLWLSDFVELSIYKTQQEKPKILSRIHDMIVDEVVECNESLHELKDEDYFMIVERCITKYGVW